MLWQEEVPNEGPNPDAVKLGPWPDCWTPLVGCCTTFYVTAYSQPLPQVGSWTLLLPNLNLLHSLFQLMSAQRRFGGWETPFGFFQPLSDGSNQLSELIQLFLAGRRAFLSAKERKREAH